MSVYSGKSDFADIIFIWGLDEVLAAKITIYCEDTEFFHDTHYILNQKEYKDLIPFLPCIVFAMSASENGMNIKMWYRPYFLDSDDEMCDIIIHRFKNKMRYRKSKAKKNNEEFNVSDFTEEFLNEWTSLDDSRARYAEVIRRYLNKEPLKPYPISRMSKHYLERLKKEMDKYDLNIEDYYERWGLKS